MPKPGRPPSKTTARAPSGTPRAAARAARAPAPRPPAPRAAAPRAAAPRAAAPRAPAPPAPTLRRVPTQDRGKARALAILDAAEHVFAAEGYESATTEAIAARAGASIGSLYQFFPNKRALFDAVSSRYLERVRALFDVVVPAAMATASSWEEILDGAVDAFWALDHQSPAFSAVWIQGRVTKELMDSAWELNRAFAERAVQVMAHFAPQIPREDRAIVATVVVEAVSGMLFAAARTKDGTSPRLILETKRMLRAYLRDVIAARS